MFCAPFKIIWSKFLLTALMGVFFLFPLTNLAVQEIFFSSRFGNHWEFWIHGLASIFIYIFYSHYIIGKYHKDFSLSKSLGLGLIWTMLFLMFFGVFSLGVFGLSWEQVLGSFNLFNRELLPVFLALILLSPVFVWRAKS